MNNETNTAETAEFVTIAADLVFVQFSNGKSHIYRAAALKMYGMGVKPECGRKVRNSNGGWFVVEGNKLPRVLVCEKCLESAACAGKLEVTVESTEAWFNR
jgi:hypothetical protein